jgi:CheY-like chemotaxis protein
MGCGPSRDILHRESAAVEVSTGGPNILIVDDDAGARAALVDILEFEGYSVAAAGNGREALDFLKTTHPNLIILDLLMPEMDGWQFRIEQKKNPVISKIPVVVVTAFGATAGVEADVILHKPINVERLLTVISHYC